MSFAEDKGEAVSTRKVQNESIGCKKSLSVERVSPMTKRVGNKESSSQNSSRLAEADFHDVEATQFLHDIVAKAWPLGVEPYVRQRSAHWPPNGQHILAHFDDSSIIVYQAYCPEIADYAVKHQRFGGDKFSFDRMSWIKTNFLWMMYRCGWATKPKQERVLAVRITLDGFNQILSAAYTAKLQKSQKLQTGDISVRLQWDPDHDTNAIKETRRAIQLGLKQEILYNYATRWVMSITDITQFVHHQHNVLHKKGQHEFIMPCERVYIPPSSSICQQIALDSHKTSEAQLVNIS